jgi:hypothetical protein
MCPIANTAKDFLSFKMDVPLSAVEFWQGREYTSTIHKITAIF